ncbi:MAG: DUF4912 domain-containing protein, partial [Planctomycetia bacterium]|nr:DUF4912 domain-containing protein [Planctomycetia bacterium]
VPGHNNPPMRDNPPGHTPPADKPSARNAPAASARKKEPAPLSTFATALKNFEAQPQSKNLYSTRSQANDISYLPDRDQDIAEESLSVEMIDPYWLHATWCIRRKSIERAKAAMGQFWYEAKPILRVTVINGGDAGTGGRFQHERDILIHGHVNQWFISAPNPPATYLIEIGYLAQRRFFSLLKSNVVTTPVVRSALRYKKSQEASWMNTFGLQPAETPSWSPSDQSLYQKWHQKNSDASEDGGLFDDLPLRVQTELVVYGSTTPDSQVTIDSEWVAIQPDGTFLIRLDVPEQGKFAHTIDSINRKESRKMVLTFERMTQTFDAMPIQEEGED